MEYVVLAVIATILLCPVGLYLWWLIRTATKRRWKLLTAQIAVPMIAALVFHFWPKVAYQWEYRKALPPQATDVRESIFKADWLLPDYSYALKAKVTDKDFEEYLKNFRLTPHSLTRKYTEYFPGPEWKIGPETWWDPAPNTDHTYVLDREGGWIYAKHENGFLYLRAVRW